MPEPTTTTESVKENSTISQAINAAETEVEKLETDSSSTKQKEKVEEKKEPEEKEKKPTDSEKAQQLWDALKDPERSGKVIEFLAKEAGILKEPETKKEVVEQKDEILELLKAELGDEFDVMSEYTKRLSKGIEKVLNKKLEESTREVKQSLEKTEVDKLTKEADAASKELADKYFDKDELPSNIQKDMEQLMTRYHPSPGQSVKDYLNELFQVVTSRNNIKLTSKEDRKKTEKNHSDVSSRLNSGKGASGRGSPDNTEANSKIMSLSDAIKAAEETVEKG